MDVDQYIGGIRTRNFTLIICKILYKKVLRDLGYTNSAEPFNPTY